MSVRNIPEDSEEDVDQQVSAAAGDEEDTERWYYLIGDLLVMVLLWKFIATSSFQRSARTEEGNNNDTQCRAVGHIDCIFCLSS